MIELYAFGTFAVRESADGGVRDVPLAPRQAALLAYLALTRPRGRVTRDLLLSVFWPELEASRARAALSQALYRLRTGLGHEVIENGGDTAVGLRWSDVWCDAAAFEDALDAERTEDALDICGGELLAGFHLTGAREFERWLDGERERVRKRAVAAASRLASRLEAEHNPVGAAHWMRRAVGWAPHDERLVRELTRLLAAAGDLNGAVHEFERHARHLRLEFELEPSLTMLAHMEALRSDRRVEPAGPEPPGPRPNTAAGSESHVGWE